MAGVLRVWARRSVAFALHVARCNDKKLFQVWSLSALTESTCASVRTL